MDDTKIEDLLECPICLNQLDERSRVLPCQHTFCIECLGFVKESKGHLQCPECRTDYANLSIENLPRNVLLVRILEGIRNSKRNSRNHSTTKRLSAKVKCEALLNQPCARGLYNFDSTEEGDLPFHKGDVVTIVREVDDNWWDGVLKGKRGSIPKNFVETLVALPQIDDDSVKVPYAKALYSYESKDETEVLSFREGDIIGIIKKVDSKWLEGILGGQYGIFPVNFVQLNNAGKEVMSAENSSSGSSSSDEEVEKRKQKAKRSRKFKKQNSSPFMKQNGCTSDSSEPKRNTIHVENPSELPAETRRALNLNDESDMARLQTVGRTVSESGAVAQEARTSGSVVTNTLLQSSHDQILGAQTSSASSSQHSLTPLSLTLPPPGAVLTTSIRTDVSPTNTTVLPVVGLGDMYTALFTYTPSKDDELALIQAEQYCVLEKHLDGWYRGFHMRSRQTGVFPGNYVKLTSQVTTQMMRPSNGYSSNPASPCTAATFSFPPPPLVRPSNIEAQSDQITASKMSGVSGILKILKISKSKRTPSSVPPVPSMQPPPSYYHSSMPGPAHHRLSRPMPLVPVEPPPPYTPLADSVYSQFHTQTCENQFGEKFRVVTSYRASNEGEISLQAGDIVYVIDKLHEVWYKGKCSRNNLTGIFPAICVEPYSL